MKLALHSPSAHSLVECMRELKFGRPSKQKLVIDEAIKFIVSRLGNDGPPFTPDIIREVFNKDESEDVPWISYAQGNGLHVAVDSAGTVWTSKDGRQWTLRDG